MEKSEGKLYKNIAQNEKKNMRHKKHQHHHTKTINASVLDTLDTVHKSLLFKNLQYDDATVLDNHNNITTTLHATQEEANHEPLHREEVFTETRNEKKPNKKNIRNKSYSKTSRSTYYNVNRINKQNSNTNVYHNTSSDSNYSSQTDLNKTVPSNFNYFRDHTPTIVDRINNKNVETRSSLDDCASKQNMNLIRKTIRIKISQRKKSDSSSNESDVSQDSDKSNDTYTVRPVSSALTYDIPQDNIECFDKHNLYNTNNCESLEEEEFHDCYDYATQHLYHRRPSHEYTQRREQSQSHQPQAVPQVRHNCSTTDTSSVYEETVSTDETATCDKDDASSQYVEEDDVLTDSDIRAPMINIVQEITQSMEVKSTITVNKAKLRQMQKNKHIRQKIIDDNFCNEILDQTFHFTTENQSKPAYEEPAPSAQSDSSVDYSCSDTLSYGTLEGKRRLSGKNSGRLMAHRLKKAEKIRKMREDRNENKMFLRNLSTTSDSSTKSSGPKKPPRTFAYQNTKISSRKSTAGNSDSTVECIDSDFLHRFERLKTNTVTTKPREIVKPSCPTLQDLNEKSVDWSMNSKMHEIGWVVPKDQLNESLPANILNMLNYSEDELKPEKLTKAQPQTFVDHEKSGTSAPKQSDVSTRIQSFLDNERQVESFGHKLDIDTVDSPRMKTPSPARGLPLNFERFAANTMVQSTPRKRAPIEEETNMFIEAERDWSATSAPANILTNESLHKYRYCNNCSAKIKNVHKHKRPSFRKNAVRRTISFFEASKRKIKKKTALLKAKAQNLSDSEVVYSTPQKMDNTSNLNQNSLLNSEDKHSHKHLGWTPVNMKSCTSCTHSSSNAEEIQAVHQSVSAAIPERPKKPVRLSLNFNKPPVVPPTQQFSFEQQEREDREIKFSKNVNQRNRTAALKKITAFKLSPGKKKMNHPREVETTPTNNEPMIRNSESYKSFNDHEQNTTAVMGRLLTHIRDVVETDDCVGQSNARRVRQISTSSEVLAKAVNDVVEIDLHEEPEPLYSEIFSRNKRNVINNTNGHNNYIIANNDPNAIYATVNKSGRMNNCKNLNKIKSHSLNNLIATSKLSEATNTTTTTNTVAPLLISSNEKSVIANNRTLNNRKNSINVLLNNSCDSIQNIIQKNSNINISLNLLNFQENKLVDIIKKDDEIINLSAKRIDDKLLKSVDDKYDFSDENTYRDYNLFRDICIEPDLQCRASYALDKSPGSRVISPNAAPSTSSYVKSDDEIFSDNFLIEGISNLMDNKSIELTTTELNEMEAQAAVLSEGFKSTDDEIGYDTVDYSHSIYATSSVDCKESGYQNTNMDIPEFELNNVSIMTDVSTTSILKNKNNSLGRIKRNSSDAYKTLKNTLRSSFRKSKRIQKKITNFFDDDNKGVREEMPESPRKVESTIKFNLDDYKKNFSNQKGDKLYQSLISKMDTIRNNETLTNVLKQISTQTSIHSQLKNALGICRNTQEFACSPELIEAERLLLLSNLKEHSGKNELLRMESQGSLERRPKYNTDDVGALTITNLEFKLNDVAIHDTLFNYFYVCVFTHKNFVKATFAKEKTGDHVYFHKCNIKFAELSSDYSVRIEIYVLRLKKSGRTVNNETKFSLNKEGKNLFLLSPSSSKKAAAKTMKKNDFECEFSQFKSQGFVDVTSASLLPNYNCPSANPSRSDGCSSTYYSSPNFQQRLLSVGEYSIHAIEDLKPFKLNSIIYNSNLTNTIMLGLSSEIKFKNNKVDGFITLGEIINDVIYWNRRWCRIDGLLLKFWNYPQENDDTDPIVTIDLQKCISRNIVLTNRSVCARPKTFTIEVCAAISNQKSPSRSNKDSRKTYFLSTDNQIELKTWMVELDRIITFLRNWAI